MLLIFCKEIETLDYETISDVTFLKAREWPILVKNIPVPPWDEQQFVKQYGHLLVTVHDHKVIPPTTLSKQITLKRAIHSMTSEKQAFYINDLNLVEKCPELAQLLWESLLRIPFLHSEGPLDLLRFLHPSLHPTEKTVQYFNVYPYIGSEETSTPLHIDTLSTSAFNVIWTGSKKWWFVMEKASSNSFL